MTGYCKKHDLPMQDGPCSKCLLEAWDKDRRCPACGGRMTISQGMWYGLDCDHMGLWTTPSEVVFVYTARQPDDLDKHRFKKRVRAFAARWNQRRNHD